MVDLLRTFTSGGVQSLRIVLLSEKCESGQKELDF